MDLQGLNKMFFIELPLHVINITKLTMLLQMMSMINGIY